MEEIKLEEPISQSSHTEIYTERPLAEIFGEHFTIHQGYQRKPSDTIKRQTIYSIASVWNQAKSTIGAMNSYDEIIPGLLYLGMQPNASTDHPLLKLARNENGWTGLNVAVVENHEIGGSYIRDFLGIISLEDYEKCNILHHWLNTPDHTADVTSELIIDTLQLMYQFYKKKIPILVHCKTGAGRSAMIVCAFLLYALLLSDKMVTDLLYAHDKRCTEIFGDSDINDQTILLQTIDIIASYLKKVRPVTEINDYRRNKICEVMKVLRPHTKINGDRLMLRSDQYCFLQYLGQTYAFKQLSLLMATSEKRHGESSKLIQSRLNSIIRNDIGSVESLNEPNQIIEEEELLWLTHLRAVALQWLENPQNLIRTATDFDSQTHTLPSAKYSYL